MEIKTQKQIGERLSRVDKEIVVVRTAAGNPVWMSCKTKKQLVDFVSGFENLESGFEEGTGHFVRGGDSTFWIYYLNETVSEQIVKFLVSQQK